jgi:glycosyltransferase involved in cell wall biosynthesis
VRITIDATALLLRSAGVKNYVWHWFNALRQAGGEHSIRAFPFLDRLGRLDHEHSNLSRWSTLPRLAALFATNWGGSAVLEALGGPSDVFHASNQVRVRPIRMKSTATLHDMTCWIMPELHTPANVRADHEFAGRVLKHADGLIAVSQNTRDDAVRVLNVPQDRIEVIYSGVDERFFHARPRQTQRPYVLFVGTIEPRKNLDTLLDAWAGLRPGVRDPFELVLAGPVGWQSERTLARLTSGAVPNVRWAGYVPESDLAALTAGASVFVYVSLYEGFGFPAAQAMAAGVAVLTSNTSCLPEVVGPGGVCVDPRSESEIRSALTTLLLSPSTRARLAKAGRERAAAEFRWSLCARKSLRFFERVLGA